MTDHEKGRYMISLLLLKIGFKLNRKRINFSNNKETNRKIMTLMKKVQGDLKEDLI